MADTKEVPLLTAFDAQGIQLADQDAGFKPCPKIAAIASGEAATYNTKTHELVPVGTRAAVERVIADLLRPTNPGWVLENGNRLQRALNGEKS